MNRYRESRNPLTGFEWDRIQEHAKESARQAVITGDASRLTALGRAYYEKYKLQIHRGEVT